MKISVIKPIVFGITAVIHLALALLGYIKALYVLLFIIGLPWSIPISMLSMLVIHAGDPDSLLTLLLLAALLNSFIIFVHAVSELLDLRAEKSTTRNLLSLKSDEDTKR